MGCFLGHLLGLKKRSYSRKRNELNPLHFPAWCGGLSHIQLELHKDVLAEWGHARERAGRQAAGITLPCCCLAMAACALCVPSPQMGSAEPCTMECARHVHMCVGTCCICLGLHAGVCCESWGSVCQVTTPGQTFQLRNGGFCPCTSHVDMVLGIHTLHAMHMHVRHAHACAPCHAYAVPCTAPARSCSSFWAWRDLIGHSEEVLLQQHPL